MTDNLDALIEEIWKMRRYMPPAYDHVLTEIEALIRRHYAGQRDANPPKWIPIEDWRAHTTQICPVNENEMVEVECHAGGVVNKASGIHWGERSSVTRYRRVRRANQDDAPPSPVADKPQVSVADVKRVAAVNAMIGYCESLEPGTVITEEYVKRMRDYYIPNLLAAMEGKSNQMDDGK